MLCHECSKGWFDKFIDRVSFLDVSLVLFLGIFLAPICICFFSDLYLSSNDLSQATNVLERYATSYESLRSTDRFLMSQIDVVDVNDGKDVAINFYDDKRGKISTVYFHVNSDLSYQHVEKEQTVFFGSQGS